jgi:hypothetical protein
VGGSAGIRILLENITTSACSDSEIDGSKASAIARWHILSMRLVTLWSISGRAFTAEVKAK